MEKGTEMYRQSYMNMHILLYISIYIYIDIDEHKTCHLYNLIRGARLPCFTYLKGPSA